MSKIQQSLTQFMGQPLVVMRPDALVMDVQEVGRTMGVHHFPIVGNESLIGVVCTCDMLVSPGDHSIKELMHDPVALPSEASVEQAIELMGKTGVGSIVLLEDTWPVGLVTRGDLRTHRQAEDCGDDLAQCRCCGTHEHLRVDAEGQAYCVFCRNPFTLSQEQRRA